MKVAATWNDFRTRINILSAYTMHCLGALIRSLPENVFLWQINGSHCSCLGENDHSQMTLALIKSRNLMSLLPLVRALMRRAKLDDTYLLV